MKTILEGAKRLLDEAVRLQGDAAHDTIIVGGWGPYLRNMNTHPGTKDVDILFPESYTRDDMATVVNQFLASGFLLSAKHDFQLFRPYKIGQHTYVFNVDLLHPVIERSDRAEFIDIIDLGITIDGIMAKHVQTICIIGGEVLFKEGMYSDTVFAGNRFRTLSPAGVILSKLHSCHNPKRPRDIFDIYISLRENKEAGAQVHSAGKTYQNILELLQAYQEKLAKNWKFYSDCLSEYGVSADDSVRNKLVALS